jgi:hypothetical protein
MSKNKLLNDYFPKEHSPDSMTTTQNRHSIIWRPNNYRRQIEVKEKTNSGIKLIKSTIKKANVAPHTKIVSIKEFKPNITIQYGRNTLTAIYSQNKIGGIKEHFLIERESIAEVNSVIDKKKAQIEQKLDRALDDFSIKFKLKIPLKTPTWSRYEDFLKGEEYIDNIPMEVIIHDTFFKKVYGDGIEFKNTKKEEAPTVHLKNYIKNRAIEDISPQIAQEINHFRNAVEPILKEYALQNKLHLEVLNNINKSFKRFNNILSQKKIRDFSTK